MAHEMESGGLQVCVGFRVQREGRRKWKLLFQV